MAENFRSRAEERLKRLRSLSEYHKTKTDEMISCYTAVGDCYAKSPDDPQLQEYNRQANAIWQKLEALAMRLEYFDLLKDATNSLNRGDTLAVHPQDVKELAKLRGSDLEMRGFDSATAEKVSGDLFNLNIISLGERIGGIILTENTSAPRLRDI